MIKIGNILIRDNGKFHKFWLWGNIYTYREETFLKLHFSVKDNQLDPKPFIEYVASKGYVFRTKDKVFQKRYMRVEYTKVYIARPLKDMENVLNALKTIKTARFKVTINISDVNFIYSKELSRKI